MWLFPSLLYCVWAGPRKQKVGGGQCFLLIPPGYAEDEPWRGGWGKCLRRNKKRKALVHSAWSHPRLISKARLQSAPTGPRIAPSCALESLVYFSLKLSKHQASPWKSSEAEPDPRCLLSGLVCNCVWLFMPCIWGIHLVLSPTCFAVSMTSEHWTAFIPERLLCWVTRPLRFHQLHDFPVISR